MRCGRHDRAHAPGPAREAVVMALARAVDATSGPKAGGVTGATGE